MPHTPLAPAAATVTGERARAFSLTRQCLTGPGCADALTAARAIGGVYASAPTCHLSFAARVDGFRAADLDDELHASRRLVRLRCMREMVYIVPAAYAPAVAAATRTGERAAARLLRLADLSDADYEVLARRIEAALAGGEPATLAELRARVGGDIPGNTAAFSYAVALMGRQARLVRAHARGSWRSDTYAYARWADWLGEPIAAVEEEAARAALARGYLASYGPATAADLKWWAGWTAAQTAAALETCGAVPVTVTEDAEPPAAAYILAEDEDALRGSDPAAAEGVRLLPVWDTYTMGYADRRRLVPVPDQPRAYDRVGNGTSLLLVDGLAAGVWDFDHPGEMPGGDMAIRIAPFRAGVAGRWPQIEEAAARAATAVGAATLRVERTGEPGPLEAAGRNAFMAPLHAPGR